VNKRGPGKIMLQKKRRRGENSGADYPTVRRGTKRGRQQLPVKCRQGTGVACAKVQSGFRRMKEKGGGEAEDEEKKKS